MTLPAQAIRLYPLQSITGRPMTVLALIEALVDAGLPAGVVISRDDFKALVPLVRDELIKRDPTDGVYIDIVRCQVYPALEGTPR